MKITTVLFCEAIEPALEFWVGRLGFEKLVDVPEGDRLGFVILKHGEGELMMQTQASVANDVPQLAEYASRRAGGIFVEVEDFDKVAAQLGGLEIVVPERTTFYGMREIVVREPGGNLVCFAAKV